MHSAPPFSASLAPLSRSCFCISQHSLSSLIHRLGVLCLERMGNLQNYVEENLPPAINLPSDSSAIDIDIVVFNAIMDASALLLDLECTPGIECRQAADSSFRHHQGISGERKHFISMAVQHLPLDSFNPSRQDSSLIHIRLERFSRQHSLQCLFVLSSPRACSRLGEPSIPNEV